jgi:hydrogenase expression/formation protein HypD
MKYINEYRDKAKIKEIVKAIHETSKHIPSEKISFMEVCGGHTMAIQKHGIPSLLPKKINLLSGPGCPVCVTSRKFIDTAIALSKLDDVIITTFGDLIRVPGSTSTLNQEKARGANVKIIYSILDAIELAKENPDKQIVFLAIGFETTAPGTAAGILHAKKENLDNFYVLSAHKIMPPAMAALVDEGVKIDGYIAPGHVSTITGSSIYKDIPEKYNIPVVISGFEPMDLLQSIYMLLNQIKDSTPQVEIQYKRAVREQGNLKAQKLLEEVFETRDDWWRGLGILPKSGLKLKEKYAKFDAGLQFKDLKVEKTIEPKGCICGLVLKGLKNPVECKLFGKVCTPTNPVGSCMVSSEGSCQAYFRYNQKHNEK